MCFNYILFLVIIVSIDMIIIIITIMIPIIIIILIVFFYIIINCNIIDDALISSCPSYFIMPFSYFLCHFKIVSYL